MSDNERVPLTMDELELILNARLVLMSRVLAMASLSVHPAPSPEALTEQIGDALDTAIMRYASLMMHFGVWDFGDSETDDDAPTRAQRAHNAG